MFLKDRYGVVSVDYLFSIIVLIIIVTSVFGFVYSNLGNIFTVKENVEERLIADNISSVINSVSASKEGYSTVITLKDNVLGYSYYIRISKYNVNIYDKFNRGESSINPINIKLRNGGTPQYFQMYSGNSYKVTKTIENNISYVMFYKI